MESIKKRELKIYLNIIKYYWKAFIHFNFFEMKKIVYSDSNIIDICNNAYYITYIYNNIYWKNRII